MLSFDAYVLMLLKTFSLGFLVFLVFKSGDFGGILNNCHPAVSIVSRCFSVMDHHAEKIFYLLGWVNFQTLTKSAPG